MNEIVRNLLTVVRNPANDPDTRAHAEVTLRKNWMQDEDVAAYFKYLQELEQHKKLRDRILTLKK